MAHSLLPAAPPALQFIEEWEAMSDADILADVERVLRQMFPDSYEQPLDTCVTRWKQVRGVECGVLTAVTAADARLLLAFGCL